MTIIYRIADKQNNKNLELKKFDIIMLYIVRYCNKYDIDIIIIHCVYYYAEIIPYQSSNYSNNNVITL